jgi:hypothetical protein
MEHSENRDVDVDVVDTPTHDCRPAVVEDAAPAACPAQKDEGDWGGPAHMYSIYTCGAARFVPVVVASSATPSSLAVSSMAPAPSSPFFLSPQLPLRHASPARSFCCLCGTLTTTTLQGGFQTRCLSEPRFSFLFFFCCGSSTNKLKHALPSVWNQDENG